GQVDDQYYLSMEYLDGQPLHRVTARIRAKQQSAKPVMYSALCEVLSALDYAHRLKDFDGQLLNLVHRDVTPQNIFITYDGVVKPFDFGIAKAIGRSTQTRQGIIKGKVAYMSPEQAMGKPNLDARSDLFAVAVMLYETATGSRM